MRGGSSSPDYNWGLHSRHGLCHGFNVKLVYVPVPPPPLLYENNSGQNTGVDYYFVVTVTDLEEYYLIPLKKLFLAKDLQFRYHLVSTLTSILSNLAYFEWPRMEQRRCSEDKLMTQHIR